jgi:hypothetical protein
MPHNIMKVTLTGYDEKIRTVMETLEFFIKEDGKYTTTDLKEADILHSAQRLLSKGFLDCEIKYIPIGEPGIVRKWNENAKQNERVKLYSLNNTGRTYYEKEVKK